MCGAAITHRDHVIRVNNRHEHAFFNPTGIAFLIRCFHTAPGVAVWAEPSTAFTWFPGYCWQIVLCAACQSHLGWLFSPMAGGRSFYGLIADRLS
ncbi:cereblon family protein [Desulfobulbus propionicus]|uniref:cereblon family protein n=1 Tax=Desulfobulbus propionicus TaxID=894 RepID=UPI0002FF05D6|nr:cereblon family protein [Desulfobulbus propionicus]